MDQICFAEINDPGERNNILEYNANDRKNRGGWSFKSDGFSNWHKKETLQKHVGDPNSVHNQSVANCDALMNQRQKIEVMYKNTVENNPSYRTRLAASIDSVRFLLKQGLALRRHNESKESLNQSNYLELVKLLADHNEFLKDIMNKAPKNNTLTSSDMQNDIVSAIVVVVIDTTIEDIGDEFFTLLVDESRDVSNKEQMAIVLRYVNKEGCIVERFLGIVHVTDTTSLSLKSAVEGFLAKFSLSTSRIRGQGYDGASNMRGEFNDVIGGSCKRHDKIRELQFAEVQKGLANDEISS
ncbi:uncharacterized protein [Rutidosis leptorrhynchoides]|uniref:uncharacterized protein n=1 Tax=Rutidosis leptorrhynchoides TaxID=125765 RepID=UPI003A99574C